MTEFPVPRNEFRNHLAVLAGCHLKNRAIEYINYGCGFVVQFDSTLQRSACFVPFWGLAVWPWSLAGIDYRADAHGDLLSRHIEFHLISAPQIGAKLDGIESYLDRLAL